MEYLAKEETARYKAANGGLRTLTNIELLALLLSFDKTADGLQIARSLYKKSGTLHGLSTMRTDEIASFNGIGECTATALLAAFELGRRVRSEKVENKKMTDADTIHEHMAQYMDGLDHEEFFVLMLRNDLSLIKTVRMSTGGQASTLVDVRMVMRAALENKAVAIVAVHNHPSGRVYPSTDDNLLTKRIKAACDTMNIRLVDHMIYASDAYYSYIEQGLL